MLGFFLFFCNATATTDIYPLSLHDALPISLIQCIDDAHDLGGARNLQPHDVDFLVAAQVDALNDAHHATDVAGTIDRKSTRLNSSHSQISYAVFCLKKKKHCRNWAVLSA